MGEKYPAIRYRDDMGGYFENGVWNTNCNSWTELEEKIEEFKNRKYLYMWRGQRCQKKLRPSIFRDSDSVPNNETIKEHLDHFKNDLPGGKSLLLFLENASKEGTADFEKALSEYYKMIQPKQDKKDPKENCIQDFIDDIYWGIGRHHGLKTPLLDWTMDPYKALFFAFYEKKEKDDKRVVFGLAEKSRLLLHKGKQTKRYIEFLDTLCFVETVLGSSGSPAHVKEEVGQMFGRIKAQEGLFTRTLYNEDIEEYIKKCYRVYKKRRNEEIVFLIKILIPNGVRKDILQKLEEEKEITYKTMFPDLFGTVSYWNLKLESL
ncbi:MAG: FRG domain-containing protein [Deltaproteobacteria bacterium]|nr:FRG domain-containing protein [Deltaproteobacteria bacterium]